MHSDISGPHSPGINGELYYMTIVDENSRKVFAHVFTKRSEACKKLKETIKSQSNALKCRVVRLRMKISHSTELKAFLKDEGIVLEEIPAYTPQLNGIAERIDRTLKRKGHGNADRGRVKHLDVAICITTCSVCIQSHASQILKLENSK